MEEKILKLFKKKPDNYLSGEQVSKLLNITRSAFWKHIEKLRAYGYEFDAVPHLGYRLRKAPDKLYSFEISPMLKTKIIGQEIIYHDTVGSTNTIAYNFAKNNAKEGTVVIAEKQTKGRGRLSRVWSSPKEKGIYLSIILRPKITPFKAPVMTLMAAVSLAQAIRENTGAQAVIKWPNDILVYGQKLSGMLSEMEAEADMVSFVNIGIGLNANNDLSDREPAATSLKQILKRDVSRKEILANYLDALERRIDAGDYDSVIPEWKNYTCTLNREVKIVTTNGIFSGLATDVDENGSLILKQDNGDIKSVSFGDCFHS